MIMIGTVGNLSLSEMNYSYLSPPSKIKHIKLPSTFLLRLENYVYEVVDGKHKRRIFGRGPYE